MVCLEGGGNEIGMDGRRTWLWRRQIPFVDGLAISYTQSRWRYTRMVVNIDLSLAGILYLNGHCPTNASVMVHSPPQTA